MEMIVIEVNKEMWNKKEEEMFVCSKLRKVRRMRMNHKFSADSLAKTFLSVCFSRRSSFMLKKEILQMQF